jgi:hypothetical protein
MTGSAIVLTATTDPREAIPRASSAHDLAEASWAKF